MGVLPYRNVMPRLAEDVFVAPGAWVIGNVEIAARSSVWFNTVVRGDVHTIRIGSETNIQDNCSLHVTEPDFPLEIGNRVTVGHRAIVHGCVVEDDCLIGMGVIILDGAKIGRGSVIAAGALITPGFVVPPKSLVMGSPAQVKRPITDEEFQRAQKSYFHYIDLASDYREPGREGIRIKGFLG